MAKIQGGVPVAGFIAPTDSNDVFPVTDPKYQKGGYRVVKDINEMNSITTARREEGMVVYVVSESATYRLKNNVFVKEETGGAEVTLDEEMLELDSQGRITVKSPTPTTKGAVKIDNDSVWLENEVLKAKKYTGDNTGIEVTDNGTIKFTQAFTDLIAELQNIINGNYEPPTDIGMATPFKIGLVKPDNSTIVIDKNGTISAALTVDLATAAKAGIVKPDDNTLQVSEGVISIKNPIVKLEQIPNVKAGNILDKKGQYLRVGNDGKSWELSRIGEASNRSFEFNIDSTDDWTEVYNLKQHLNVAIAAQLECKASKDSEFDIKFVATSGSEVIEHVNPTLQMYIPNREFHVSIFAKGKGKILLDILLVF